jgi:hypothetical protein
MKTVNRRKRRREPQPQHRQIKRTSRRQFLKWLGSSGLLLSGGVSQSLVSSIFRTAAQTAAAGAASATQANPAQASSPANDLSLKSYLFINLFGSPPHWLFQCPLKPNASDPFIDTNKMTANRLAGFDSQTFRPQLVHSWTEQGAGQKFWPHLWSQTHYIDGQSATAPIAQLLQNLMVIRTGGSGVDGHTLNSRYLATAGTNGPTLRGMIADKLGLPIHAVHIEADPSPASSTFKSPSGVKSIPVPPVGTNPSQLLLDAFSQEGRHDERTRPPVWNAITAALDTFRQEANQDRPALEGLFTSQRSAENLLQQGASEFSNEFAATQAKYAAIITKNLRSLDLQGVNDQPVPGLHLPLQLDGSTQSALSDSTVTSRMLPGLVAGVGVSDMRQLFAHLEAPHLAAEFALAEMALKRELCGAIVMNPALALVTTIEGLVLQENLELVPGPGGTQTLKLRDGTPPPITVPQVPILLDTHGVGSLITLLLFSSFYRALSAAISELIRVLKNVDGKDLFKDCLIHCASEFNRSPDQTQAGSDHDPDGGTHLLWSGRISGPQIIGDIRRDPKPETVVGKYTATNGQGAKHSFLSGQEIRPGNILASIASLFEVDNPTPNSRSLLRIERQGSNPGRIVSFLPAGKTVIE